VTAHSFVDESKSPSYLMAAAMVRPANLSRLRQEMAAMVLPRQRRIHFNNERDSRRSQIMGRLAELPIEAVIYEVSHSASYWARGGHRRVKAKCLVTSVHQA